MLIKLSHFRNTMSTQAQNFNYGINAHQFSKAKQKYMGDVGYFHGQHDTKARKIKTCY